MRYRFGAEWRARWRGWLAIALLAAGFAGPALAGMAGAIRTDTAYARFNKAHKGADLLVEDFIPNPDAATVTHAQVAATKGVAEAENVRSFGFEEVGFDGSNPDTTTAALTAAGQDSLEVIASADGQAYGSGMDRPKLLAGRFPDPANPSEVAVDFTFPRTRLGTKVTVLADRSLDGDPHQPDQQANPIPITFTIVGVVAAPGQFPPQTPNNYYTGAAMYATPAFYRAHTGDLIGLDIDLVRLAAGTTPDRAENQLQTLSPDTRQVPVNAQSEQAAEVERSTHLEALALWVVAGLIGVVGLLVLGHILARAAAFDAADFPTLRSMGLTRGQGFALGLLRLAIIGVVGGALAVLLAVAISPLTPIGLARVAEPSPGFALNWAVLGLGFLAVAAGCPVLGALPLWLATAPNRAADAGRRTQPSIAVARLSAGGASPAATCGVWMALEPGRGRRAVPVRSTLAGAAIGLAALAGALTLGASLTHLLGSPRLYGVTWDTDILNNNGPDGVPAAVPVLQKDPDVAAAAYRYAGIDVQIGGHYLTQGIAFIPVKGALGPRVVAGRAPAGDSEIALGTRTMDQLHLKIGNTIQAVAENQNAPPVSLQVVGRSVLPPGEFVGRLGVGVVVTEAGLERMADVAHGYQLRRPYIISVAYRPGANVARAQKRLLSALTAADPQFLIQRPPQPNDLVNFGRVQNLPLVLAGLLALLAAATVTHLLVSSVRRRRGDLAVLKTFGFDRSQVRRTVAWQATTLALIASIVGIPLGIAAGRLGWDLIAGALGTVVDPITPALTLILVIPGTLVLANLVAAGPAALAARIHPADALRTE